MITGVAMITRVTAMITGRVAMMDVAAADSRWRSFPLRGPLPFSGANAAPGYLPLQLTLRYEGRKLKICPEKGLFYGQRKEKTHFVRRMAVFPDEIGET